MDTQPQTASRLSQSVFAVPPLARDRAGTICRPQNERIIRHLEGGGVDLLLYGGNAVLYHVKLSEYAGLLSMLRDTAGEATGIVPSIGPAYGTMLDQIEILRDFDFPTVMVLPARDIADAEGIARGIRHVAEKLGKPLVVYLKFDRWLPAETVGKLYQDGLISWVKYAVVRDDPRQDDYLREVLQHVPGEQVVSGIGEQPAIIHMRDFGVQAFTSGCVCVAPAKSMEMLRAIQAERYDEAEALRAQFEPLEDLRNEIHPIRVLHRALETAGIAETGPMWPLLGELSDEAVARIRVASQTLLAWNAE